MNPELLHKETLNVATTYKKSEAKLIELLMRNDETKTYLQLNYSSLHVYCTKGLGLSDAVAYSLSTIARKSRTIPEIRTLIQESKITVSNATQVARVITLDNKASLLEMAQTLSKRDLEKEIKRSHPESLPKEKVRILTSHEEELKVVMTKALSEDLKFLKDHYSRKSKASLGFAETLMLMAKELRERHDPVKKAERNLLPGTKLKSQIAKVGHKRTAIVASLLHSVNLRDKRRCTFHYVDGTRCENRRWLEIHHIQPVSRGGTNTLDNLTTLCSSHHKSLHLREGFAAFTARKREMATTFRNDRGEISVR